VQFVQHRATLAVADVNIFQHHRAVAALAAANSKKPRLGCGEHGGVCRKCLSGGERKSPFRGKQASAAKSDFRPAAASECCTKSLRHPQLDTPASQPSPPSGGFCELLLGTSRSFSSGSFCFWQLCFTTATHTTFVDAAGYHRDEQQGHTYCFTWLQQPQRVADGLGRCLGRCASPSQTGNRCLLAAAAGYRSWRAAFKRPGSRAAGAYEQPAGPGHCPHCGCFYWPARPPIGDVFFFPHYMFGRPGTFVRQ
jgi:hypothetical protein